MEPQTATTVFESLASGVRLDIFRLLVRMSPQGMVAGEIATTLGVPPTNLSFHLKAMAHAGLVTATQEGRFQRYRANLTLMSDLIAYLTEECCGGNPQQCAELSAQAICPACETAAEANLNENPPPDLATAGERRRTDLPALP